MLIKYFDGVLSFRNRNSRLIHVHIGRIVNGNEHCEIVLVLELPSGAVKISSICSITLVPAKSFRNKTSLLLDPVGQKLGVYGLEQSCASQAALSATDVGVEATAAVSTARQQHRSGLVTTWEPLHCHGGGGQPNSHRSSLGTCFYIDHN